MFKKKFIHIVRDEKFIDSAWRDFERVRPGQNLFLIIGIPKKNQFLRFVKVRYVRPRIAWILAPFSNLFCKGVLFHSIGSVFEENIALRINPKVNVVWISWGYDLYPRINNLEQYLKPKTRKFFKSNFGRSKPAGVILESSFKNSFRNKPSDQLLLNRFNYIAPVLESEFDLLSLKYNISPSKYIRWNYLNIEEDIISLDPEFRIQGNSLLLGHSGSIWLNHLDALDQLDLLNISVDRIIIPCSYGDDDYIRFVKGELRRFRADKIHVLDEFLPYEQYISMIKSCKYLFIDTPRQIGLGNILFFLYYGGIVIVDETNPVVDWFDKMDFPLFKIDASRYVKVFGGDAATKEKLRSFWGYETKTILTSKLLNSIGYI